MRSSALPTYRPAPLRARAADTQSHFARNVVLVIAFAPVLAALFIESAAPWDIRALAAFLWVLSAFPAFAYLRRNPRVRRPIPFMPALSLTFGLYYVLPLVLGVADNYYNAPVFPSTDYAYPLQLAFLGWVAMCATYIFGGAILGNRASSSQVMWRPGVLAHAGFFLMLSAMGVSAMRAYLFNSALSGAILQFVLSVQWLGTGILIILERRGELSRGQRVGFYAAFILAASMLLANGNIAPMVLLFAIGAFAMWIAKPQIRAGWILGVLVAVVVAVSFRGIVIDFRRALADRGVQVSRQENLSLMVDLLRRRLEQQGVGGALVHGLSMTAGRSAVMDLFANVARRTPSEIPHWGGDTYSTLATSMIPRFLWPDKPVNVLGQTFAHRYAYIHASNKSTAINLPFMVEFFVNFGGVGVLVGMAIVGFIYRILDNFVNRPGQSPLLSMIGVVILLPLLMIESDFSLVFGGLILTGIAFSIIWWQFRVLLGTR